MVWKRFIAPGQDEAMVGDSSLEGPLTKLQEYENALVRADPYNDGVHISGVGDYVTQTGVKYTYPMQVLEPEIAQEYDLYGELTGEIALVFREIYETLIVRS
jgi:hypothetical protein